MDKLGKIFRRLNLHRWIPTNLYSQLTGEEKSLLKLMQQDNLNSVAPYKPSPLVWSWLSKTLESQIHLDGPNPENSVINSWFASHMPGHKKYYFYAAWNFYKRLQLIDKYNVLEKVTPSASDKDEALIIVDGKPLSWDFLLSAESVIGILDSEPSFLTEKKIILDVGAGWGRIGYFLNQLNPKLHIVIADIPMTLFVAHRYLESIIPTAIAYKYESTRQLKEIDRQFLSAKTGISFIGTHSISSLNPGSIDLTINVASFQEMELKNIHLYMVDINKFSNSCYLMQRKQSDEASFNFYVETAESLGWKTALRRETTFAPNYEEAFFLINTKS